MKKMFIILFTVLLFSCSDDSTSPNEDSIIGTWLKEGTIEEEAYAFYIVFNVSNEYYVYSEDGVGEGASEAGTYVLDGNEITMTDSGCEGDGIYSLKFNDNQVVFTPIEDDCNRREYMTGAFKSSTLPEF
jgi:hypothetical protein